MTVLPPATGVKVRTSGQGEILKLVKRSSGQARNWGQLKNDQSLSRWLMGVVNAPESRVKARFSVQSRGQA